MLTIVLLTTLLAIILVTFYRKRSKLPPGPFPLTIIGNLHQFGWKVLQTGGVVKALKEWKKEFGPVYTLWLGPQPTVHICSMDLALETMVKRGGEFVNRWFPSIWTDLTGGLGIIASNGDNWMEQRRFALHTFRNFGLGRGIMEERIMMELNYRTDELIDRKMIAGCCEIDAKTFFNLTVGSIINRILFNQRYEKEYEKEFFALKNEADKINTEFGIIDNLYDFPFLRSFPFLKQRWARMIKVSHDVFGMLRAQVVERMDAIERGDHAIAEHPEDYVDAFLVKMKEEEKFENTTYTVEGLVMNLSDLWQAGQDTTVITLQSAFLNLLQNLDVVEKIRKELLTVTRGTRHLSLKDKLNTPYFNSVCTEIQRIASILSTNLSRETKEDTFVGGHPVPSRTPIAAEISVLMSEDSLFENAEKFDPSRYQKHAKLEQNVNPFGIGKRVCLGESLARAEIYLICGNLILNYDVKKTDEPLENKYEDNGFLRVPPTYKMRLSKLNNYF